MPSPVTLADLLAPVRGTPLAAELEAIRRVLSEGHPRTYLVGGLVRDLLLGRTTRDIDLAVAGPVEEAAERLAEELGAGKARYHRPFMTAGFVTGRGFAIDLARLRRESYREPGALPEVSAGSLAEDLFRRDFTVNAMAVDLASETSRVIDFHDGFEDLADGRLRVLHPDSFRDDPTRVLRGLRLRNQIGLEFEEGTRALAAEPATRDALGRVSGFRLWRELRGCFDGVEGARRAVTELRSLDLLGAIHPALEDAPFPTDEALSKPEEILREWCAGLHRLARWELAERLALTREERLTLGVRPPGRQPQPRRR